MRRKTFLTALCAFAVTALIAAAAATAGTGHFVGTPYCSITGSGTSGTATIDCSGKIAGYGNYTGAPITVYVVITTRAGCENPGNDDIPGQRNFASSALSADTNGNIQFGAEDTTSPFNTVTGSVSCNGQQLAFIESGGTLSIYNCTSGVPTFNNKKNPTLQTNPACDGAQDTSPFTLV